MRWVAPKVVWLGKRMVAKMVVKMVEMTVVVWVYNLADLWESSKAVPSAGM